MVMESPTSAGATRLDRVPPQSEDAERGVLGSILLEADRVLDICIERQLVAESFYLPTHRTIFDVMLGMKREERPVDLLTVTERLKTMGMIDRIGGPTALDRLVDATPTSAHAEYYIDIVRQKHLLRSIIERARDAERSCYRDDQKADTLLAQIEESFFAITEEQHGSMRPWPDLVKETMVYLDHLISHDAPPGGVPTGFGNLDKILVGREAAEEARTPPEARGGAASSVTSDASSMSRLRS